MTTLANTELFDNRAVVSIQISAAHNDLVNKVNEVYALIKKHNAQHHLWTQHESLIFDKNGNIIGTRNGSQGGRVIFHSHSCNASAAAAELEQLLNA